MNITTTVTIIITTTIITRESGQIVGLISPSWSVAHEKSLQSTTR